METEKLKKFVNDECPGAIPLLLVIRGSHAYGTNVETSDVDYGGIFAKPFNSLLSGEKLDQINDDNNDIVIYELEKFLNLLSVNNPNILELLNTPEDCILYKNPLIDVIINNKDKFISKLCYNSFSGYAISQIKKAKGQNKKQNWEKSKIIRKTPLDFCYIHKGEKSIPLIKYMNEHGLSQEFCGLSNIPHSKDTYALFYDYDKEKSNEIKGFKFKGIAFEKSNELRLSSIPKECTDKYFIGHISYNKDGYTKHCKDYKSYQTWLNERNESRWVDVKKHGQKIDGKNMMHCVRLIEVSEDIANGKGVVVRRPNAKYLLSVRKGEVDLNTLIDKVENKIKNIEYSFEKSDLPESVDKDFIKNILVETRKKIYKL